MYVLLCLILFYRIYICNIIYFFNAAVLWPIYFLLVSHFPGNGKKPSRPRKQLDSKKNEKETSLDFKKQVVLENNLFFLAKR